MAWAGRLVERLGGLAVTGRALIAGPGVVLGLALVASGAHEPRAQLERAGAPRFSAVAFDYFVLFNPDSVESDAERIFPGKGRELTAVWRTRQFEYTWLRSLMNRYVDFFAVTEDALVYAASATKLELTAQDRRRLMDAYLHLAPWPDTAGALRRLRQSGIRVIALANFSPRMLRANAEHAGLLPLFDGLVSTDGAHTYKPDPRAYRLGMDHLRLPKDEIVFAAFGGWDAAGAKAFGYPTVWVNRSNQPGEELGVHPDRVARDLNGLLEFVLSNAPRRLRGRRPEGPRQGRSRAAAASTMASSASPMCHFDSPSHSGH